MAAKYRNKLHLIKRLSFYEMLKPEIKNTQNSYQCVTTYCMAYIRETNKQMVIIQLALLLKYISLKSAVRVNELALSPFWCFCQKERK